jgi:hypothetical protein
MPRRSRLRSMLPLAAVCVAAILGGCVAYPAYPSYPTYGYGYGYPAPYYGGVYVGGGGGWHDGGWRGGGGGWHGDGWRR